MKKRAKDRRKTKSRRSWHIGSIFVGSAKSKDERAGRRRRSSRRDESFGDP